VGTSTLLGGILLDLVIDERNSAPYGFVFGSVGDCKVSFCIFQLLFAICFSYELEKAFLYSATHGNLTDLTNNSRQDSLDPTGMLLQPLYLIKN